MKREINPTLIYTDGKYLERNSTWHTEDSPYKASLIVKCIQRNNVAFRTCADVGCGAGFVTEILAKKYPAARFSGYELSGDAQRFWTNRTELENLEYATQNILDEAAVFDLVVCLDVFEHIEDYFGFLRVLRLRGRSFIFNIPLDMNAMKILTSGIEYAREEVGHLHYFNQYSARKTLEDCGYKLIDAKLSAAFLKVPPRNLRQCFALPFRLTSILLGKTVAAKLFGGISLLVFAKTD